MTEQAPSLLTFYKGWASYQRGLMETISPLTSEQLALPAGSHQWTVGELIQHIVANRVWWFQTWMGQGDSQLAPIAHWDPADPVEQAPLSSPELVAGLESTWEMIADTLAGWTAADLDRTFQPPDTLQPEERELFSPSTSQWIIWHVLEHEIHHGGELSLVLGSHGLEGIYGEM